MQVRNKKVNLKYQIFEKIEVGIALTGNETKAIKKGKIDLTRAYVKIIEGEAYLLNAVISSENTDNSRTRKLLLHKDQIISINTKVKAKKLTIVPTKVYTKGRLIKLEIALAKPKRKYQKKQKIKAKDIERETQRALKDKN